MTDKVKRFKEYIEGIAEQNYADYDAVEMLDGFNYADYDNAIKKINKSLNRYGEADYNRLFTEHEMLKVGVMYACICSGAINSYMTNELRNNWADFEADLNTMRDIQF